HRHEFTPSDPCRGSVGAAIFDLSLQDRCEALPGGDMLTDPRIHSFLALCKHGTTTAAAAATHRALSTISTHVSAVEARVGATLFKRAHGTFTLTELGEEVRRHAETIVAAEAAILAAAALIKQSKIAEATAKERTRDCCTDR